MAQISILKLNEIEQNNRIDSEFYKKEFMENEKQLSKHSFNTIKDLTIKVTDGSHQTPDYRKKGIPFLMIRNIGQLEMDFKDVKYIDEKFDAGLKHCKPDKGDILMSKVGTLGRVSIVPQGINFNIFVSLAILKGVKIVNSSYLATFLLTKHSTLQQRRFVKGIAQPDLHLEDIRKIKVPIPSQKLQEEIEILILSYQQKKKRARELYLESEDILLKELNLDKYEIKHDLTFVQNLSEVRDSKRIDADYFQPKYKKIIKKLKIYKNKSNSLGEIITSNRTNFCPKKEESYNYLELSNINSLGEILDPEECLGRDLPTRARRKTKEGEVIISSIEGSLSSCALITKKQNGFLCSNGFHVLSSKFLKSEVLLVFFKSMIGRALLKKGCSGTILSGISYEQFKKIEIPLIRNEIQTKIVINIKEANKLREEAIILLTEAKDKIENFIESKK